MFEDLRMNAGYEDLLVVGAIEDADEPALRQTAITAPEEIMVQLLLRRRFECGYFAAAWVHARHDVFDGAVLAGRIHRL